MSSNSVCDHAVINKSGFRCAVVRFYYHSYDYRPNWTPLSPIIAQYLRVGFRQKCLADHSVIRIAESIRCSVDNKKFGCGIFIDFKLGI